MPKIKVGLVGFGIAAKVMHAPFITTLEAFELTHVLERHSNSSKQKYPTVDIVRDIDELISIPEVELIVITTPNSTHFEYAKKAILAGKHVVLEKPFTITTAEALELVELSKNTDRVLSVYQNRRYVCDFLTIKKILSEQLLGDVVGYEAHYDRYRPEARPNAWREENAPGSGILYDLGAHLIDQALYLFGIPKSINADLRMQRPHARATDYFDLRLDYGKMVVRLKSGMLVREPGPRYMIHGTKGSFIKSGEDPQEELLRAGVLPNIPHWGEERSENWGLLHTELNGNIIKEKYPSLPGGFGMYYQNLYNTIVNHAPLKEKPEHGYNTIRMVELATESNQKKCSIECTGLIESNYQ